jgi:acetyltransferase-like isoleucine patch superfamily enzyme
MMSTPPNPRHARLTRHPTPGANSLWQWRRFVPLPRVVRNFLVIYLCRYLPFLSWKNHLYRWIGVRVGERTSMALSATLDIFFPELISLGDNCIVGYHTIVLAHEFLGEELRTGPVVIGRDVVIGASCTVLPGVVIGDGAVIAAHSLVNRDVAPGERVGGVPARPLPPRSR